jgi:hypothetical protein
MLDSIRIKTRDEQTAVALAEDILARYRPRLVQEHDEWEVRVESESEDDLPDLLGILRERLHGSESSFDVVVNGETLPLERRS